MQVVHIDEDKRNTSKRTNTVDTIICTGRISRCLEGKHARGLKERIIEIWEYRRIFGRHQERIWRRGQRISKSSRIEKDRVERKNNEGVHIGV